MKYRNILLLVLVLCCAGCTTVVKVVMLHQPQAKKLFTPPPPDHTLTGTAWTNSVTDGTNSLTVLHLSCSNAYSCGYYHGKFFAHDIEQEMTAIFEVAVKLVDKNKTARRYLSQGGKRTIVNVALDKTWAMMEPYIPQAEKEEMAGLVDGMQAAGVKSVSLEIIHRVMVIPDLTQTTCSALIAEKSATTDGHVYQLRILDYGSGTGLEGHPLVMVYHASRPGDVSFVNVGWVGFTGLVSGMNAKKVAISEMGLGHLKGDTNTLCGMPMIFLLKNMLRHAGSASEGAAIISFAQRTSAYAYGIGDANGGAVGMVTTAHKCEVYPVNESDVIDDGDRKIPQFKDVIYAGHNCAKQHDLVAAMLGKFDLQTIQSMARQIRMDSNLHTVIYDLTTGDMWIANGITVNVDNKRVYKAAADCPYIKFPFSAWASDENQKVAKSAKLGP